MWITSFFSLTLLSNSAEQQESRERDKGGREREDKEREFLPFASQDRLVQSPEVCLVKSVWLSFEHYDRQCETVWHPTCVSACQFNSDWEWQTRVKYMETVCCPIEH